MRGQLTQVDESIYVVVPCQGEYGTIGLGIDNVMYTFLPSEFLQPFVTAGARLGNKDRHEMCRLRLVAPLYIDYLRPQWILGNLFIDKYGSEVGSG